VLKTETATTPRVALTKGRDRYTNIRQALLLVQDDIRLEQAGTILIKPNLTSVTVPLATTHVDAVRAVLDFLRERTSAEVIVAEGSGSASESARVGFRNFGYHDLRDRYGVRLVDLNADDYQEVELYKADFSPIRVRVAKSVMEADFCISICPPKTHDSVVITASIKNLAMGSVIRREAVFVEKLYALAGRLGARPTAARLPLKLVNWVANVLGNDKLKVHQGYPVMNLNLYGLAKVLKPDLAVVDGLRAMEGEGPVYGEEVQLGVALAGTDAVAVDSLVARLMGFDARQIGYLTYCWEGGLGQGDVSQVLILGERMATCTRHFRPHPSYDAQLAWRITDIGRLLDKV